MIAILLYALLFGATMFHPLSATTYTNKTFISPRPAIDNMALRYASWHHQLDKTVATPYGTSLQITPLYQHSTDSSKPGRYFGYFAPHEGHIRDYIDVVNANNFAAVGDAVWASYLVHDNNQPNNNLSGKIQFKPRQEIMGAQIDLYQSMDNIADGLFFELSLPIVEVKQTMNLASIGQQTPITLAGHPAYGKTLFDFLSGNVFDTRTGGVQTLQDRLENTKIAGEKHRTGLADIGTKLGYCIFNSRRFMLSLNAYCDIPAGNAATGEYLFEPLCGNGRHYFIGVGSDINFPMWKSNNKYNGVLFSTLKLSYGLRATDRRTIGIQKDDGTPVAFGHYYLIGQKGVRQLFPFANIATQDMTVEPKTKFEALINLSHTLDRIVFDVGYNFFCMRKEGVSLKNAWLNDTYAIATIDYDTSPVKSFLYDNAGNIDITDIDQNIIGQHTIQEQNINISAAQTPSQITHKMYATLGFQTHWKRPLLIAVGGSYEWAQKNSALSNYALWANGSFTF